MTGNSDLVDVEVVVMDETPAAYAIQNPEEDAPWKNWIWLPKSTVELEASFEGGPHETVAAMPEWLAHAKGLL